MSSEDPTDDELEREAGRDVGLTTGGTRHHAPRLETVSRAIDLREMRPILEAEREASDTRMGSEQRGASDRYMGLQAGEPRGARASDHARRGLNPSPLRSALRPAQAEPAPPSPHPTPYSPEAQAWDRFVIAALPIAVAGGCEDPEGIAAQLADRLLEERRRRFA